MGTKLEARSHALRDWAREQRPGTGVLLFIDQFEEIFTYREETLVTDGGNAAALFIDLVLTAIEDPGGPLYGVLAMRTDYLGKTAFFRGLAEALNNGHYLVPRLTRLQLQDAIERPAESRGVTPSPALVQRLLNDCEGDPGQAPRTSAPFEAAVGGTDWQPPGLGVVRAGWRLETRTGE